jgi:threonine dehydratase
MQENYVDRILKAKVYDVAVETSLESAPRLSRRLDNRILFKREDLQPVFSFKIRGAYNKIAQLSPISAQRGVICASAGNHAQGVALGARTRGIPAVIVMPLTSPDIKVQAVADLGGEIVLHGDDYDHAYEHALELGRARGLVFVHPFDDPDVIAGQGTIAMEILRQHHGDDIDAIFVPVGGGGLIWDRRLREVPVSTHQDHRRRAGRRGRHARFAAGRETRHARSGRHVCRRGRRAARRRGDVSPRAPICG